MSRNLDEKKSDYLLELALEEQLENDEDMRHWEQLEQENLPRDEITPRWDYLVMISADMEVTSYNSATVSVDVDSDSRDVDELRVTVKLQQFDGGWKDYKTWTETVKDSLAMFDKKAAIPKGYSYQIEVTAKAYKNGKFLESATETFDYGFYQ